LYSIKVEKPNPAHDSIAIQNLAGAPALACCRSMVPG